MVKKTALEARKQSDRKKFLCRDSCRAKSKALCDWLILLNSGGERGI